MGRLVTAPTPVSGPTPAPPPPAATVPASRSTRLVMAGGTAVSVVCFAMALVLEFLGRPTGGGSATDPAAVASSVLALEPWGWATLGTYAVIVTPALAIVATGLEYAAIRDRRTAWTAVAVLVILGVSLVVSLLSR